MEQFLDQEVQEELSDEDRADFFGLFEEISTVDPDVTHQEFVEALEEAESWEEFIDMLDLQEAGDLTSLIDKYGKGPVKKFLALKAKAQKGQSVKWVDGKPKLGKKKKGKKRGKVRRKKQKTASKKATAKAQAMLGNSFDASVAQEDVNALFAAEDFSAEFRARAATILEAAIVKHVNEIINTYQEQLDEEEVEQEFDESVTEQVDRYLNYVVEEWMEENKLAVDTGIRNDITEQFITGMKSLFETSYIDIPEDKVDVVSELTTKVEELQSELNEEKRFIIEMTEVINQLKQDSIIEDVTDNLVKVDSAKIKELAENVEFINENDFRTKVETLKESYFPGTKKILTEDIVEEDPVKQVNGTMGVYTSTLDRMLS